MKRVVLKYGVAAALITSALVIVPFWMSDPATMSESMGFREIVGYATMVVAMSLVFFAIREQRGQLGRITFGGGFAVGAAVTLVAACGFGLATVALYAFLMSPEQIDVFMRAYVAQSAGSSPESVAAALRDYETNRHLWHNPWFQGLLMFGTILPIGLIATTISAIALRSRV